jgi:hypothetical protein
MQEGAFISQNSVIKIEQQKSNDEKRFCVAAIPNK